MMRVDLTAIYNLMFKFYGSREMQMSTFVERKHFLRSKELKMTFDYYPLCHVDMLRLHRRLGRHINGVREFFVSFNDNKIEIYFVLYRGRKLQDYDFEFSQN